MTRRVRRRRWCQASHCLAVMWRLTRVELRRSVRRSPRSVKSSHRQPESETEGSGALQPPERPRYLLKEDFQQLWNYESTAWAAKFLDQWCRRWFQASHCLAVMWRLTRVELRRSVRRSPRSVKSSHRQPESETEGSGALQPPERPRYLLKEDFQQLWNYESTAWAAKFLDQWCRQVMRSRIEPMKKVARTLRAHRDLILNYFRARKEFSSGVIEGLNNKAKVTMRKSYGFRTFRVTELALYHSLGKLPEPELTHRFF